MPRYVLDPFVTGLFDPLTDGEQEIGRLFRYRTDQFYLIGTSGDSGSATFDHEVCHGLYYTCEEYKEEVDAHLEEYDLKPLFRFLKKSGYCDEVLMDEAHAYISASGDYLERSGVPFDAELQKELKSLHKTYLKQEKKP